MGGEMLVRRVDNMRPHGFGGGNKMAVASAISHSQISNCLGSIQKSCAISYSGSSSQDGDFDGYGSDGWGDDDEEEDCDVAFGLFDDYGDKQEIISPSPQPTKSKGEENKISNKSLHDKMMAL